jgi:hypothetical protein
MIMGLDAALARLRQIHADAGRDPELRELIAARDSVLARYQPMFTPEGVQRLTEEDFRLFLQFKNNRHWVSLQRLGPAICTDMGRLRKALAILLDESRPVRARLNDLVPPKGPAFVPRLSKAVLTPILLIAYPERYGVWNQVSEGAMKTLGVWPDFESGQAFGHKYEQVNGQLVEIAGAVGVDLWVLDALWWRVEREPGSLKGLETPDILEESQGVGSADTAQGFGLERHLHQFIRDNWDKTSLGRDWKLYEEDGEEVGYEYPCGAIGRIDLLARHRKDGRWLVVELKRNQTGDQVLGQVLRYMGWVERNLAGKNGRVEGLVIAREAEEGLRYALSVAPAVGLQLYEVDFRLKLAPKLPPAD